MPAPLTRSYSRQRRTPHSLSLIHNDQLQIRHEITAPKFVTQATEIAHEDAVVALFSEAIEKAKDDVQKEQPRDSSVTDPARGLKLAVILQRKYISVIPEAAVELVKLDVERLSVAHNRLRQMPTRLASCHNLRYINLRRNRFKRFPEPLLEMTNLEILDLSKNGIESIPESIQNLKALRILSLELNRLTDLPTELVNINCLDLLIVTGNPLQTDLLAILLDHTLDIGNYPKAQKHCEEAATKDIREYLKQRQNNVQQKSQIGTAAAAHSTMLQEEVFRASEATARLNNRVVEATHSIAEDADTLVTHVTDGPSIHHIPTQPNTKINLPIQTNGSRTKFGKSYNGIHIQDNATVIMGDVAGNLVQEIHHHHHAKGPVNMESYPIRLERRNECFGMHTLETITSYQEASLFRDRGTSTTIVLRWTRDRDIGRGLFGEVYTEKQNLDCYPQVRAIKVLQRRHLMRKNVDYKRELGFLMRLARSDYKPYFVEFFTWFETEEKILIATEFVMGGDLSAYIHNGLSDEDSRPIALQIMQGLCILHRLDIVHRESNQQTSSL